MNESGSKGVMPWRCAFKLRKIESIVIIYVRDNGEAIGLSTIRNPSHDSIPQNARGFLERSGENSFDFIWKRMSHETIHARSKITAKGV